MKVLLIADDFTGALDTAVQFAKKGIPTLVTIDCDITWDEVSPEIQVLSINAETRHLTAQAAYEIVKRIVQRLYIPGKTYLYKKTDSSLRGNIGSEIAAVMEGTDATSFYFAPAFPRNGRTTENGKQYCYGKEIHHSVFADDLLEPVNSSNIEDIIHQQTAVRTLSVPTGNYSSAFEMNTAAKTIYIFDASTQDDLDALAKVALKSNRLELCGGSAGFAAGLSHFLPGQSTISVRPGKSASRMYLVGSINPTSLEQIAYAAKCGYPVLSLTAEQRIRPDYFSSPQAEPFLALVTQHLATHNICIVCTVTHQDQLNDTLEYSKQLYMAESDISTQIVKNIGMLTSKVAQRTQIGSIVVFGGDTLLGVMNSLGSYELEPIDEVCSGVVVSQTLHSGPQIISKAGGFGGKDIIPRIEQYLSRQQQEPIPH